MAAARLVLAVACAAPTWLCGCLGGGDDSSTVPPDAGAPDTGRDSSVADASSANDAAPDVPLVPWTPPAISSAYVRWANWSPNAPALDLCLAPHGTGAFFGPLVSAAALAAGFGPVGMAYPLVSLDLAIPPGSYDARLAVAGDVSCSGGIIPDRALSVSLQAGSFHTISAIGDWVPSNGEQGPSIAIFEDRQQLAESSVGETRFINAYTGVASVDLWASSEQRAGVNPNGVFFQGVPYAQASSPASLSTASGIPCTACFDGSYRITTSFTYPVQTTFGVAIGSTPLANLGHVDDTALFAPAVLTVVLVGAVSATSAHLLQCIDNAGATPSAQMLGACCSLDCDPSGVDPSLLGCCGAPAN